MICDMICQEPARLCLSHFENQTGFLKFKTVAYITLCKPLHETINISNQRLLIGLQDKDSLIEIRKY